MEYLVTMTTQVPDGTPAEAVADVRGREAAHTGELAAQGHVLRLWRPPLAPGEWRTLGLFAAAGRRDLDEVLASMPLRVWRSDEVTELAPHPNDPVAPAQSLPGSSKAGPGTEFFTTFVADVPDGTPTQVVRDARDGEARRTRELAEQGRLTRLWLLPAWPDGSRALGLWRSQDAAQMRAILDSLPMAPWLTEEITPLEPHPSDPAATREQTRGRAAGAVMNGPGQRVAVITGAAQGIGAGLVTGYREQGWAVVANSLTIEPSDDPAVLTIPGDVSEAATADRIVSGALDRFGRIDTLVNNAGVFVGKPFEDYTIDDYQLVVHVNLTGFFLVTQRVIDAMLKGGGGHVVNISTTIVEHPRATSPALLAALTKGGLVAATKSLAIEYAARGIRSNAVSLGVIETPLHPPDEYAALGELHPIGRVGQVSDVVQGILYLESAPFVTGEILHIDGGQSAGG